VGASTRLGRRAFIEDTRRDGTYLRVTWHPEARTFVVSHWDDSLCTAATRVAVEDAVHLIGLLADGLGDAIAIAPEADAPTQDARRSLPTRLVDLLRRRRTEAEIVRAPFIERSVFDDRSSGRERANSDSADTA
jgi:hypothetical protein